MAYEVIFKETDALFRVLQNKAMAFTTVAALECMRLELDCFCDRFETKCSALGLRVEADDCSVTFRITKAINGEA